MKTKLLPVRALALATTIVMAIGCQKEKDEQDPIANPSNATNLGSLTIDQDFNWSSALKGNLIVKITSEDNLHTENQPVHIITADGEVLERSTVVNGEASFYVHLPQSAETYIHYPNTRDIKALTGTGTTTFKLTSMQEVLSGKTKSRIAVKKSSLTTGVNLLKNSSFNIPAQVATTTSFNYNQPTAVDGTWYINNSSYSLSTTTIPNDTVLKLSLNGSTLYWGQTINVAGGSSYSVSSLWINSGRRVVISFFDSNDQFIGYHYPSSFGNNVGGQHSGTVPATAEKAMIWSSAAQNAYVDNVKFISTPTISDSDGDGVADDQDDFPNDPNKAYLTSFPSLGTQYLAFEDLWPYTGDFDFNDMVLQNYVLYTRNANNYLVEATFHISLNALGAGLRNGLGVEILNSNKQPFGSSVISSVSGHATSHSTLNNALVVFNDAHDAQSTYYTNTGSGPSASPDMFQFTVTFTPNTVSTIVPDLYIFRTNDPSHEIHLDGFNATAVANTNLANTGDDYNGTYNTENGLPWAIEIVVPGEFLFYHPLEKVDILIAYPRFQAWAQSNGSSNTDWYQYPVVAEVFQ